MGVKDFFIKYGTLIKDNLWKAWVIVYCVWLIDLFSTVLAVGMNPHIFFEGNPVAAWFFDLGVYGWFIWAGCCGLLIWILLKFPQWSIKLNLLLNKKRKNIKRIKFTFHVAQVSFFCLIIMSETLVIIHNFYLLIRYFFA